MFCKINGIEIVCFFLQGLKEFPSWNFIIMYLPDIFCSNLCTYFFCFSLLLPWQVAWVTRSGQSELAEPIAIRPTSETGKMELIPSKLTVHRVVSSFMFSQLSTMGFTAVN